MFKTEKSARYGLLALMALFAIGIPAFYLHGEYGNTCLSLGFELIFYWAYLNPWILLEKYRLFFYIDTSKMVYNRFLVAGGLTVVGAAAMLILH